ncbi:MAG: c-type cytochrome [Myxococcota bacterium]
MMRATLVLLLTLPLLACTSDLGTVEVTDDHRLPDLVNRARELPPSILADRPPVPVSGGTLWAGDSLVVAAESDRDQIHVISRTDDPREPLRLVTRIQLLPGEEPGRVVEGGGSFFVVLRGAGAIAVIEDEGTDGAVDWRVTRRFAACAAPRGLDYAEGALWVACLDGTLLRFDAATGDEQVRTALPEDLRDVVVTDESIFVSRFKSAEVLILEPDGELRQRVPLKSHKPGFSMFDDRERVANGAYRMVKAAGDRVFLSHQLSSEDTGVISRGPKGGVGYGGGQCTGALVVAGLTAVRGSGEVTMSSQGSLVVPMDVAYTNHPASLQDVAIAAFGARSKAANSGAGAAVAHVDSTKFQFTLSSCQPLVTTSGTQRAHSVAYADDGTLLYQTTHPHGVWTASGLGVRLEGEDNFDAGHDLFFGDAGTGIACASCHPGGGEDGLTWIFEDLGPRRTQDLRGGIMNTAPFHWQGDIRGLDHLMEEVMGRRMGGPELSADYIVALSRYIDGLGYPATPAPEDDAAIKRGQIIFESSEAACASCHSGETMGGPGSFDVGTGLMAQVPHLRGLRLRAPYMHDGCAVTLRDRFDPECGGARHGRVGQLSDTDIDDLIAYLKSL